MPLRVWQLGVTTLDLETSSGSLACFRSGAVHLEAKVRQ